MSTSTLHFEVERSRFANLLLAALGAAPLDKAALEAQAVREMARSYARTDPSFAADLYAAADRHELLNAE